METRRINRRVASITGLAMVAGIFAGTRVVETRAQDLMPVSGPSVVMGDDTFMPSMITVPAYTPTTVSLVNYGVVPHNFAIPALGVYSGDYVSGQAGSVSINAAPGYYEIECTVPGHKGAGMVGTLIVQ